MVGVSMACCNSTVALEDVSLTFFFQYSLSSFLIGYGIGANTDGPMYTGPSLIGTCAKGTAVGKTEGAHL